MNLNRALLILLPLFAACTTQEPTDQGYGRHGGTHFNANLHAGYRRVQGSGWSGYEDQAVAGVSADFTPRRWPIGFEAAAFGSSATHEDLGRDADRGASDVSIGLRKSIRIGSSPVWLYAGAGVAAVSGEQERTQGRYRLVDDDSSAAWYGHVGAYCRLANRFNLGLDARTTQNSELEIFGGEADADHWQVTVFFGWGW